MARHMLTGDETEIGVNKWIGKEIIQMNIGLKKMVLMTSQPPRMENSVKPIPILVL